MGAVGSTCGPASLMSFTLNGDEAGQWLIELSTSPSHGLEITLINILIFLFCLPHWSGRNLEQSKYQTFPCPSSRFIHTWSERREKAQADCRVKKEFIYL